MKKSLLIAAVAMAMGFGISAHAAVSNATFGAWSFEGLTPQGVAIPASGMTEAGYESWSASSNDTDFSYVTNVTPTGVTFPIVGTHDQSVYFNGGITNQFNIGALDGQRYTTDFLLKPGQLDDPSSIGALDAEARLAFYFNTASNFVLLHRSVGLLTSTTNNANAYTADAWVRITIDQDYRVGMSFPNDLSMFRVFINGVSYTNAAGYTRTGDAEWALGGANPEWFQMRKDFTDVGGSKYGMNALVGLGMGMLDDVVVSTNLPTAPTPNWKTYMNQVWSTNTYLTSAAAAAADTDGDGINDLDEAFAGTDPMNAGSLLKIGTMAITNGVVWVSFQGSALGQTPGVYQLMEADLVAGSYSNVAETAKVAGSVTMTNAPAVTPKFYRIYLPYTAQ